MGEIGEHRLGVAQGGGLGVEEHFFPPSGARCAAKASRDAKAFELVEERQPAAAWRDETGQEEPPEQAGEHPDR